MGPLLSPRGEEKRVRRRQMRWPWRQAGPLAASGQPAGGYSRPLIPRRRCRPVPGHVADFGNIRYRPVVARGERSVPSGFPDRDVANGYRWIALTLMAVSLRGEAPMSDKLDKWTIIAGCVALAAVLGLGLLAN